MKEVAFGPPQELWVASAGGIVDPKSEQGRRQPGRGGKIQDLEVTAHAKALRLVMGGIREEMAAVSVAVIGQAEPG